VWCDQITEFIIILLGGGVLSSSWPVLIRLRIFQHKARLLYGKGVNVHKRLMHDSVEVGRWLRHTPARQRRVSHGLSLQPPGTLLPHYLSLSRSTRVGLNVPP
jgi:hypothetical protein